MIKVVQALSKEQILQLKALLSLIGWHQRQIEGQIEAIEKFLKETNCVVLFALEKQHIIGYISAQFYAWNNLGQIHGLVVHPDHRNKGIATKLVKEVEVFMKGQGARGIYADTPVDNVNGCHFYKSIDFEQAYIMPEYYDVGQDGVTFQKFF